MLFIQLFPKRSLNLTSVSQVRSSTNFSLAKYDSAFFNSLQFLPSHQVCFSFVNSTREEMFLQKSMSIGGVRLPLRMAKRKVRVKVCNVPYEVHNKDFAIPRSFILQALQTKTPKRSGWYGVPQPVYHSHEHFRHPRKTSARRKIVISSSTPSTHSASIQAKSPYTWISDTESIAEIVLLQLVVIRIPRLDWPANGRHNFVPAKITAWLPSTIGQRDSQKKAKGQTLLTNIQTFNCNIYLLECPKNAWFK